MLKLSYNQNNNRISFDQKKKTVKRQQVRQPSKKSGKNTLEQRIRKLENENKSLWEAVGKLETLFGLKKSKEGKL